VNQKRILVEGAKQLGLKLGKKELDAFDRYTQELMVWSNRVNLTGHRDQESIEVFHYLDSLALFQTGAISSGLSLLDVGSGAGFPGLPLKILEPSLEMTLLEPSERRGTFLRYLIRLLDISNVNVEVARAEEFNHTGEVTFQRILSRAVGSMAKVCSWTASMLEPGGLFLFQKSRKVNKEVHDIRGALNSLGLEIQEVKPLTVPFLNRSRYAVIIRKTKE
jgi:16S rRNA (guanine527-N7)-methyltransferase